MYDIFAKTLLTCIWQVWFLYWILYVKCHSLRKMKRGMHTLLKLRGFFLRGVRGKQDLIFGQLCSQLAFPNILLIYCQTVRSLPQIGQKKEFMAWFHRGDRNTSLKLDKLNHGFCFFVFVSAEQWYFINYYMKDLHLHFQFFPPLICPIQIEERVGSWYSNIFRTLSFTVAANEVQYT